jgi:integrase
MNQLTEPISSEPTTHTQTTLAPTTVGQTAAALAALIAEWQLALRAENKSPGTIAVYSDGTGRYLRWCETTHLVPMARTSLHSWMAQLLDTGAAPGTVRTRQLAVKRFTAWLIATEQLPGDPFAGIKGPAQRYPVITPLSDDQLRALIATCTTPTHRRDEPLHHRRDEAIIRLMFETGIRAGEPIALRIDDLDLVAGRITIRFGKGGRGRVIPVGPATVEALQGYLSMRQQHCAAETPALWLGARGTRFGYDGLGRALRRRARLAGIKGFHPPKLRHTAAHRWLANGGSESGLMAMAGWTRTDMLVRYTRAAAGERAAAEARRLDLGNL